MLPLKITIVGDGGTGKSSLVSRFTKNILPTTYIPTIIDNQTYIMELDNKKYNLTLWIVTDQEDYDILRPRVYINTNCFIICYSIDFMDSYDSVLNKWYPEIKKHNPDTQIILVGTKLDLRISNSDKFVKTEQGNCLKRKIKAYDFIECSAFYNINLREVFERTIDACEYSRCPRKFCLTS